MPYILCENDIKGEKWANNVLLVPVSITQFHVRTPTGKEEMTILWFFLHGHIWHPLLLSSFPLDQLDQLADQGKVRINRSSSKDKESSPFFL